MSEPVGTNPAREALAQQQGSLLAALRGEPAGAMCADGLNRERVTATAQSLFRKRCKSAAKACPRTAEALGDRFVRLFAAYAAAQAPPSLGGPLADGRAFLSWLPERGEAVEQACLEAMAIDLHWTRVPQGLAPRRGPVARVVWLHRAGRLVLGARIGAVPSVARNWTLWWSLAIPFIRAGATTPGAGAPPRGRAAAAGAGGP